MSILEILEEHQLNSRHLLCACGDDVSPVDGADWLMDEVYSLHRAHQAQVLEEHMREQVAHERAHTIQMIRDKASWDPDETDDYGRVTMEGYLTIGTRELEKIEGDTGFDRMCFTVAGWEQHEREAKAEALEEAADEIERLENIGDTAQDELNEEQTAEYWLYHGTPKTTLLRDRAAQIRSQS